MPRRLLFLLTIILALSVVLPVGAQTVIDVPPPVLTALAAFNTYLTQPINITQLDTYRYAEGTFSDTSLGCELVIGSPLAFPVVAYQVQLVYQGVVYEFRVSADNALIVPCSTAFTTTAIPIIATPAPMLGTTGCPVDFAGYLSPRLQVGGYARIGLQGEPNRMRAAPLIDAEQLGLINPGSLVEVQAGPFCEAATSIIWWQVRDGELVGYTAEGVPPDYFLDPVTFGEMPVLPGERNAITPANAASLIVHAITPFIGGAAVDFGNIDQLLVASTEGVLIYDLNQLVVSQLPLTPGTVVLQIEFSPNGRYIAYTTDQQSLFVYDAVTQDTIALETEPTAILNDLSFSVDNMLAVAAGDPLGAPDAINGWYLFTLIEDDVPQSAFYPTQSWVGDVAWGPGGIRLAWLTDTVNYIVLADQMSVITNVVEQPTRSGLAWQPVDDPTDPASPRRVAYADGNSIRLLELETATLVSIINEDDYVPGTITFNADGTLISVLNRLISDEPTPRTLKLFEVASGNLLYSEEIEGARGMTASPDGTLIVVLTDDNLRFYGVPPIMQAVG